jgi:DNA-binding response OmpR family regulator
MARILIVDDDPLFLAIMSRALEDARHDVVTATQAQKAIELFGKIGFDAVVCDLVLPDQSGLQVIREARHQAPDLAIIAISGGKSQGRSVHVDVLKMAQLVGANAVVKKPFEVFDFVSTVEATIASTLRERATSTAG